MAVESASTLSCYISAPRLVDTTALRDLLAELGSQPISIEELPTAGQAFAPVLRSRLRQTSFICAVLAGAGTANVYLEIGLGVGLGKPLFMIVEDDRDIPVSLQRLPYVKASLNELDTIRFHLDAFIASLPRKNRRTESAKPVRPPHVFYGGSPALEQREPFSAFALAEQEVANLFAVIASQVTLSARVGDFQEADALVWLRDSGIGQGSPILIEVKTSAKEAFPDQAVRQVQAMLSSAHLHAAIIVTGNSDPSLTGRLTDGAMLYSISLQGLRKEVASGTLVDNLRRTRNRLFHGVS